MSDTTTNSTRTSHAVPDPAPLAQLSVATGAVYAKLVTLTDNDEATTAELARAAGLGRSTTGKALATLEEKGLATRTPGGHDGPRRTPDRWRAAPAPWTSNSDDASAQDATPTDSEPSTTHTSESQASHPDNESTPAAITTDSEASSIDDEASVTTASVADSPHDTSHQGGKQPTEDVENEADAHRTGSNDGPEPENAPGQVGQANLEQPTAAPATAAIRPGERKRLAPGALRQLVIDHLQAHPDGAFTATKISRVIEKSSGAIANALDKLVKDGIAEQTSDRPRTYRMATPDGKA
ncbi:helix-turn-helix domain-containing protein [Streptomyces sp. NPDC001817]|uniref:MarR family transcriptional regulator n=1 Tax=Streptomyces sp. NPDC001817 TaxID=3154398 RepID=UPI00331801AF